MSVKIPAPVETFKVQESITVQVLCMVKLHGTFGLRLTSTNDTDGLTQDAAAVLTTTLPVTDGLIVVQLLTVISAGKVMSLAVSGSVGPVMVIN